MPILEALSRLMVEFEETASPQGEVRAHGIMSFGAALKGPPGRVHGGHHAVARTLPILERVTAHEQARTFPCEMDVRVQRGLPLEEAVAFDASYSPPVEGEGWELTTRFLGTSRLVARARAIADRPLLSASERERWRALHADSSPAARVFEMFGTDVHRSEKLVWVESRDPRRTNPGGQHAAFVNAAGAFGPAFLSTQLDTMGAVARGADMAHPHFTKHIVLKLATGSVPADTHLLCLGDRTSIEEDRSSTTAPVEIEGRRWGTARVQVAVLDASFERAYATASVTVHPIDPRKFGAIRQTATLSRED